MSPGLLRQVATCHCLSGYPLGVEPSLATGQAGLLVARHRTGMRGRGIRKDLVIHLVIGVDVIAQDG